MRKVAILTEVLMAVMALYLAIERPPIDNSVILAWLIIAVVVVMELQQRDITIYLEEGEE